MHYSNMLTLVMLLIVPVVRGDIKILDIPDKGYVGSAPCARTCAGIGRLYDWVDSSSTYFPGKVYKRVPIADCDFVTPPVVTAATGYDNGVDNTKGASHDVCPSVFVNGIEASRFRVYSVEGTTATKMRDARCEVYWSAFGYVC